MGKRVFRYLSHPQVKIDPLMSVPDWGLSDVGSARVLAIRNSAALTLTKLIVSSAERKAMETATLIAEVLHLPVSIIGAAHENDRSATGFLPPPEFEQVATHFFANPHESIRGWERAIDAQARIVSAAQDALAQTSDGDILMVGHGGVGTLLYCHFADLEISRAMIKRVVVAAIIGPWILTRPLSCMAGGLWRNLTREARYTSQRTQGAGHPRQRLRSA